MAKTGMAATYHLHQNKGTRDREREIESFHQSETITRNIFLSRRPPSSVDKKMSTCRFTIALATFPLNLFFVFSFFLSLVGHKMVKNSLAVGFKSTTLTRCIEHRSIIFFTSRADFNMFIKDTYLGRHYVYLDLYAHESGSDQAPSVFDLIKHFTIVQLYGLEICGLEICQCVYFQSRNLGS